MLETIHQDEDTPATYPDAPTGLSTAAAALAPAFIWQRLETWTAYRWSSRAVTWIVDGPGEWVPPLAPATVTTVEVWQGEAWEAVTLSPSPFGGYCLTGPGPYRFTATVGASNPPPPAVLEAFTRLAEYWAAESVGVPGASSYSVNIGQMSESIRRHPAYLARALEYSGAADLLRPYRRAA